MSIRKMRFFLLIMLLLGACVQNKEPLILNVYYLETCQSCQSLKTHLLTKIEELYGSHLKIVYYNMDDETNMSHYQDTLDQLDGVDLSLKENSSVPFLALEGYFGTVGYTPYLDEKYLKLIEAAFHQEDLSHLLFSEVWLYKEEYRESKN